MSFNNHADILNSVYSDDLAALGLVDAPPDEAFDNLTLLAAELLQAKVSLVSIVETQKNRQFFKSQIGLPEPWASRRETPLSHSFCQYVRLNNQRLVVPDARRDKLLQSNLAIRDLGVIAYLGVPVHRPDGQAIGALCVIEGEPRDWTDTDVDMLEKLAKCASDQILLRASLMLSEDLRKALRKENARARRHHLFAERIALAFNTPDLTLRKRFEVLLEAGCDALGTDLGTINKVLGDQMTVAYAHGEQAHAIVGRSMPTCASVCSVTMRDHKILVAPDFQSLQYASLTDGLGRHPKAYLGIPLIFDNMLYGTMSFSDTLPQMDPWAEDDIALATMIGLVATSNLARQFELDLSKWST